MWILTAVMDSIVQQLVAGAAGKGAGKKKPRRNKVQSASSAMDELVLTTAQLALRTARGERM